MAKRDRKPAETLDAWSNDQSDLSAFEESDQDGDQEGGEDDTDA